MKTVNVRIKNNRIVKVDNQDEDIKIPELYGKGKMMWIFDKLEEKGYIMNGDNMKIIPFD